MKHILAFCHGLVRQVYVVVRVIRMGDEYNNTYAHTQQFEYVYIKTT